jgi:16S rRNA (guanine966-N2)-methyltransferase
MRVIAGKFRGRKLLGPKTDAVRPTPDRVREALFNIVGDLEDARVLDLFCGTGAVAIESLSRGAKHAVLVDRNVSLAQKNSAKLGLENRVTCHKCDFRQALLKTEGLFDLIFADPPYQQAEGSLDDILGFASKHLAPDGILVFEHPKRAKLSEQAHAMERTQTRLYGDSALSFYVHQKR